MTFERMDGAPYIHWMRSVLVITAIVLAPVPVLAEEETGKSLMEQGAELFFEGLRKEMEPTLDNLRDLTQQLGPSMRSFMEEMGPALADLARNIQDWSVYEVPEMLPNGDIIIRRKPQSETPEEEQEPPQDKTAPGPEIDI